MKQPQHEDPTLRVHNTSDWEGFIYEYDSTVSSYVRHYEPSHQLMTETAAPRLDHLENSLELTRHRASEPREAESQPLPKLHSKPLGTNSQPKQRSRQAYRSTEKSRLPVAKVQPKKPLAISNRRPLQQYPRVPIARVEEKHLSYGTVVYRGMMPRTADRFFSTLKEAAYEGPIAEGHNKDRLKEPLTFNSKFECGNLNYAVRVRILSKKAHKA